MEGWAQLRDNYYLMSHQNVKLQDYEEAEWVSPDRYMRGSEKCVTNALHASVLRARTKCNAGPVAKVTIEKENVPDAAS
jgi:hypothetical protein